MALKEKRKTVWLCRRSELHPSEQLLSGSPAKAPRLARRLVGERRLLLCHRRPFTSGTHSGRQVSCAPKFFFLFYSAKKIPLGAIKRKRTIQRNLFYFKGKEKKKKRRNNFFIFRHRISVVEMSGPRSSVDIDSPFDLWLAEQYATYFEFLPGGGGIDAVQQQQHPEEKTFE